MKSSSRCVLTVPFYLATLLMLSMALMELRPEIWGLGPRVGTA